MIDTAETTTKYVEAAALLNNEGVDSMHNGSSNHAFEVLLEALQVSKLCFLTRQQQEEQWKKLRHTVSQQEGHPDGCSDSPCRRGWQSPPPQICNGEHAQQDANSPPRQHCIIPTSMLTYTQGIKIELPTSSNCEETVVDSRICAATVTFNLALLHHRHGRHGDTAKQAEFLQKAKLLYSKCHALLLDYFQSFACPHKRNEQRARHDLLTCAVFNNIAALEYEFMNYDQSRVMFENLIRLLQLPLSSSLSSGENSKNESNGASSSNDDSTDDEAAILRRNRFFMNAMIHQCLSPVASAA